MINKLKSLIGLDKNWASTYKTAGVVSISLFLMGCIFAIIFSQSLSSQNTRDDQRQLDHQTVVARDFAEKNIKDYEKVLLAAASIFGIKQDTVTRADWKYFYDSMKIRELLPSSVGLGYVKVMTKDELPDFIQSVKNEGFNDFSVKPSMDRELYTAIDYIEPFEGANLEAFGYDMFSEPTRQAAMIQARDTAHVVMSEPVILVQDKALTQDTQQKGVLLYYPIYKTGSVVTTKQDREQNITGYVYVALRPYDFMANYLKKSNIMNEARSIELRDTTAAGGVTLFASGDSINSVDGQKSVQDLLIDGRTWQIRTAGYGRPFNVLATPWVILGLGIVLSLVLSVWIFIVLVSRLVRVEASYEKEMERTKDELLALTSHQLRTPASGVKQYLGILTGGIVGKLSPAQEDIAKKAFDANERQIKIINEMLYVSKIDAGQLRLEPREFDLTAMTRQVIELSDERVKSKKIDIKITTKKSHKIVADDRYIMMVIDNLLSNAIKYSYEGGRVRIMLKEDSNTVLLSMTDNGVGIPAEYYERIFRRFDRLHNPLSHTEGGSGLGLFLASHIAHAHGGDILVKSKLDKGSTFTLILPKEFASSSVLVNLDSA